jgi:hypothetical protein
MVNRFFDLDLSAVFEVMIWFSAWQRAPYRNWVDRLERKKERRGIEPRRPGD